MRRGFNILLMLFCPLMSFAQTRELGVFLGISQYQGDLAATGFTPEGTKLGAGAYFQQDFLSNFSAKAQLAFTKLEGDDAFASNNIAKNDKFRKSRNLRFYSPISELDITINLHLFSPSGKNKHKLNPYIFAGAGFFRFNPKTTLYGKEYELRDLPTELNKPKYALTQLSIPMGFGVKKMTENNWTYGLIFQFNYTFTDYIDDVSGKWTTFNDIQQQYGTDIAILGDRTRELDPNSPQKVNTNGFVNRGKYSNMDTYYYVGFTVGKRLGSKVQSADGLFRGKFKRRKRCPSF